MTDFVLLLDDGKAEGGVAEGDGAGGGEAHDAAAHEDDVVVGLGRRPRPRRRRQPRPRRRPHRPAQQGHAAINVYNRPSICLFCCAFT